MAAGYDLGEAGRAWTRRSLKAGGALSRIVLATVDIAAGDTTALGFSGQRDPEPGAVLRLEEGFGDPTRLSRAVANTELLAIIKQIAVLERGAVLIVEDDLRRAGDPALGRRANDATFQIGANIYHYLDPGSGTSAADLGGFLIRASSGYPLNAFVTPRDALMVTSPETVDTGICEAPVRCIINSVFDNEAYAVWQPHKAEARIDHGADARPA